MSDSTNRIVKDGAEGAPLQPFAQSGFRYYLLLWSLFFLICFGLGYPSLSRYQPRAVEGLSDTALYYQLVTGSPQALDRSYMRYRLLVPFVAKPFYWFARSHLTTWDAVFFGLLVANSIFCAAAACLLVCIGNRVVGNAAVALFAAALYLLNFAVPNLQLAGLVDSAESCFMLAIVWTLLKSKWGWLPIWGILGTLAKETFVPFASVFTIVWWFVEVRRDGYHGRARLWQTIALMLTSLATLISLHSIVAGHMEWPWEVAEQANAHVNYPAALFRIFSDKGFWYVFAWLLPLGILRVSRLPQAWVWASLFTGLTALGLGAWKDMMGTAARPLFGTVGPLLCLSVAILLTGASPSSSNSEAHRAAKSES